MLYSAEEARKAVEEATSLEAQLSKVCERIKERAEQGMSSCEITIRKSAHPKLTSELERLGFEVEKYFEGVFRSTYIINW